ncbi:TBC domain protein [Dictyocaulus viviparus]|uniref:TBC domain protein n=1 Tax=Dictyocaulus viviparus TaxID=29172 RepID=A0A0D8XQJ1_DICVI|nr:TBC domain protein [Dictyocaulus viviparus]
MSGIEDEDTFEDGEKPAPLLQRGVSRESSSFARLSLAIRRSLRLPSRSSGSRSSREKEDVEWESLCKKNTYPHFTKNSDTPIGKSLVPSRLDEIRDNRRLNRMDKVKKIVRKGEWPTRHEVRQELWRVLCHSKDYDSSKALYRTELEEIIRNGTKVHQPQFLSEEGVVVNNFDLNEQGAVRLLRLLTVIEQLRPEISSAPMLYPLCALMLHYLEDEDVFACVQHLLVSKGYLMTSPVQWSASSYTILSLLKKHKPYAYTMLKQEIGTGDDAVLVKALRDWLSWIFSGLPLSHVVRVIDCYLVEGHKFVTRAAIAIIYIWAKSLKNRSHEEMVGMSQEERVDAVKLGLADTAQQIQISSETFIQTAIRIRNLQSSTITRLQTQYENKVREEVNRQQSQKRGLPRRTRHLFTHPFSSVIVDQDAAAEIMSALPPRLQLATPRLLFRLSNDGASFTHFWSKVDVADQTLLLIKTTKGEKFGAYCSSSWAERNDRRERSKSKYFGTGESFVWVLEEELELPIIYGWVGNNNEHPDTCPQMFMAASDKSLVIGSGDGDAIRISEELTHGMSSACRTFANPALVQNRSFDIHELEVFDVLTGS